ncbi:hypothetical protein G4H71_12230 [Rhodococcus triatomae]|uniref:Uncharacterized protein n=1 Tax=Rhodococcus triatomae TaxID=300028 RepID=A0A1G8GFY4_9NOCA|nr:hypothetical protein [Rhodococcus triatomae]QNG20393.1 hypothetical protein G4H72_18150 [Rhodococcus triatomae]QNG23691.1 hypothetical protein G4H71_12230 [Rhodococcus triatomae]SDH93240.1 hypothetical protein SAMN05444695_10485 [Rhodococcus triatomae]
MNLDAAADELYELPPSEFVGARTRWVQEARSAGDRSLATAIGKLKKPTTAAWTVNLLARTEPGAVQELLQLGVELGDAQRRLSATELRELSSRRQATVHALTGRAAELAAERGHRVGETVLRDVAQTLGAALADPDVAVAVRSGRLLTATSYSGFGPVGLSLVTDVDESVTDADNSGAPVTVADSDADTDRSPETAPVDADRLAAAEEVLTDARRRAEAARARLAAAEEQVAEVTGRIEQLRRRLENAEQEGQFAISSREDAQRELTELTSAVSAAESALQALRDRAGS